jgi:hypothetical protein
MGIIHYILLCTKIKIEIDPQGAQHGRLTSSRVELQFALKCCELYNIEIFELSAKSKLHKCAVV